jgi:hypothetical protein
VNMWKNTDPRFDFNKRGRIVMTHPGPDGMLAAVVWVETKNSWSVFSNIPIAGRTEFLGPDDNWDDAWWWTRAPEGLP